MLFLQTTTYFVMLPMIVTEESQIKTPINCLYQVKVSWRQCNYSTRITSRQGEEKLQWEIQKV